MSSCDKLSCPSPHPRVVVNSVAASSMDRFHTWANQNVRMRSKPPKCVLCGFHRNSFVETSVVNHMLQMFMLPLLLFVSARVYRRVGFIAVLSLFSAELQGQNSESLLRF